jgi:hypothetical protein
MSKQYNKSEKRQRRKSYLKRLKSRPKKSGSAGVKAAPASA